MAETHLCYLCQNTLQRSLHDCLTSIPRSGIPKAIRELADRLADLRDQHPPYSPQDRVITEACNVLHAMAVTLTNH